MSKRNVLYCNHVIRFCMRRWMKAQSFQARDRYFAALDRLLRVRRLLVTQACVRAACKAC